MDLQYIFNRMIFTPFFKRMNHLSQRVRLRDEYSVLIWPNNADSSLLIDWFRVKMAIKKQLQSYGSGFDTPEHLINAAFSVQRQQERRENYDTNNPSGALLGKTH